MTRARRASPTGRWRALRSLGCLGEALGIQQDNLTRAADMNDPDGYIHEGLAECLLSLGRPEEARPHFAHEPLTADPWLAEAAPERLRGLTAHAIDAATL